MTMGCLPRQRCSLALVACNGHLFDTIKHLFGVNFVLHVVQVGCLKANVYFVNLLLIPHEHQIFMASSLFSWHTSLTKTPDKENT